ncbi:MAG TPA: hypothetical protein VGF55_27435 [Gemmataceae bacterium]|jgi:hypothetical protein
MLTLDHMRLVGRDPREVRKLRTVLAGAGPGELRELRVEHCANGKCCRKESWPATWARIAAAVKPVTPVMPVDLDHTADLAVLRSVPGAATR